MSRRVTPLQRRALGLLRRRPVRAVARSVGRWSTALGRKFDSALRMSESPPRPPGAAGSGPPIVVEFIGPSGVGKTTLARALRSHGDLQRAAEAFGGILSNDEAVRQSRHGRHLDPGERAEVYSRLVESSWQRVLRNGTPVIDRVELIRFRSLLATRDLQVRSMDSLHIVLFDEGFVHNFGQAIEQCLDESAGVTGDALGFLSRRIIIHVEAPATTIVQRALQRLADGGDRIRHRHLSPAELESLVHSQIDGAAALAERLRAVGVPVLTVSIAGDGPPDLDDLATEIIKAVRSVLSTADDGE